LKISSPVVGRILREEGVVLHAGSEKKLASEQIRWAQTELRKGRSLKDVSVELGVSTTLVRLRVRQLDEGLVETVATRDEGSELDRRGEGDVRQCEKSQTDRLTITAPTAQLGSCGVRQYV
jgi:transposase